MPMINVTKLPGTHLYLLTDQDRRIFFNPYTLKAQFSTTATPPTEAQLAELGRKTIDPLSPMPLHTDRYRIEVTLQCNCACSYCLVFKNNIDQLQQRMSTRVAGRIIDEFNRTAEGGTLMIIGGEPLTNWPVVRKFIEEASGTKLLFTNGTLITDDMARFLARADIIVCVSLDGTRADNARRVYSNGQPMYDDAVRGFRRLKERGVNTAITCLATNATVARLPQTLEQIICELQPGAIGVSMPHFIADGEAEIDVDRYTDSLIQLFPLAKQHRIHISQLAQRLIPLVEKKFRVFGCKAAGEQITFYPNGRRTLCTKLDTLLEGQSLTSSDLLYHGPLYTPECTDCIAVGVCGGGCYWDGLTRFGGLVDRRECQINPRLVAMFLWDMYDVAMVEGAEPAAFRRVYQSLL